MKVTKNVKRATAGTAMAGALAFGILGVGSGIAAAKPGHPGPHGHGVTAPASPGDDNITGNDTGNDNVGADVEGRWDGGNVDGAWLSGMPPGHNPFGPPGQVRQMATLDFANALNLGNGVTIPAGTVLPNPFRGIAPGQWGSVNLADAFHATVPSAISWLPPGSGLASPMPLVWDSVTSQWGVTVNGAFTPYPIQFPAPAGG